MDYKYVPIDYPANVQFSTEELSNTADRSLFIPMHWHNSTELIYCVHGSMDIKINSKHHPIEGGALIFVNSAQCHSIKMQAHSSAIIVNFKLETFGDYRHILKTFHFDTDSSSENHLELFETRQKMELLHELSKQDLSSPLIFKANYCMNQIIFLLLSKFKLKGSSYQSTVSSQKYVIILSEITSYIGQHYSQNLTLEMIAEKFSYSPTYFSKFFKKHTKQSFSQYLANTRLAHGYYDLMQTDLPLKQIALNNGFPSVRSFSTLFKEIYGSQPNVYRKIMANKPMELEDSIHHSESTRYT